MAHAGEDLAQYPVAPRRVALVDLAHLAAASHSMRRNHEGNAANGSPIASAPEGAAHCRSCASGAGDRPSGHRFAGRGTAAGWGERRRGSRCRADSITPVRFRRMQCCSATIKMDGRIASSRNAPERVEHCLTRMLPAPRQFVNRITGSGPFAA